MSDTKREQMARILAPYAFANTGGWSDVERDAALLKADEILSVLESPSEGMIAAGVEVDNEIEHESPGKAVRMIYGAMIAAIRKGA